jgi:uncharacterized membrane protein YdcZ (DUF606 family)
MAATSSAMIGAAISSKTAVTVQMVMSLVGDNRGILKLLRRRAPLAGYRLVPNFAEVTRNTP